MRLGKLWRARRFPLDKRCHFVYKPPAFEMERWPSGQRRLTRNQVSRKGPGVRIPLSPPQKSQKTLGFSGSDPGMGRSLSYRQTRRIWAGIAGLRRFHCYITATRERGKGRWNRGGKGSMPRRRTHPGVPSGSMVAFRVPGMGGLVTGGSVALALQAACKGCGPEHFRARLATFGFSAGSGRRGSVARCSKRGARGAVEGPSRSRRSGPCPAPQQG